MGFLPGSGRGCSPVVQTLVAVDRAGPPRGEVVVTGQGAVGAPRASTQVLIPAAAGPFRIPTTTSSRDRGDGSSDRRAAAFNSAPSHPNQAIGIPKEAIFDELPRTLVFKGKEGRGD